MSSRNLSFKNGFEKISAPAWYYEVNRTMNPLRSMKNYSASGLKKMKLFKDINRRPVGGAAK
jgi:hypothetical protein